MNYRASIIIIINIFLLSNLNAYETKFTIERIKTFKVGSSLNEFNVIKDGQMLSGMGTGPSLIKYNKKDQFFYIIDGFNERICIYDLSFNQINEISIKNDDYLYFPHSLEIYDNGFLLYQKYLGAIYYDKKGNIQWSINFVEKYFDNKLENNNYFYDEVNNLFFFYMVGDDILCFSNLSEDSNGYVYTMGKDNINKLLNKKSINNIVISEDNRILKDGIVKSKSYPDYYRKNVVEEDLILIDSIDSIHTYWYLKEMFLLIYDNEGKYIVNDFLMMIISQIEL